MEPDGLVAVAVVLTAVSALGNLCREVIEVLLAHLETASLHIKDQDFQNAIKQVFSDHWALSVCLVLPSSEDLDQLGGIFGSLACCYKALELGVVTLVLFWMSVLI